MANTVPRPLRIDPDGTFDSRYWLRDDPMAQGPAGEIGPPGPPGPPGPDGQAIRIRWIVANSGLLPSTGMVLGDGALVGAAAPYVLWVYANNPTAKWNNAGTVTVGPQGVQGEPGPTGPQPPLAGSGTATTAAKSDHTHAGVYALAVHEHAASDIASGTLAVDRVPQLPVSKLDGPLQASQIPSLDAAKIASGTLSLGQVPDLPASKVTSGTLSADRVPALPASKITSGTLDADRVPGLDAGKVTSGKLAKARIPNDLSLYDLFPNNATAKAGSSACRVGPSNSHAVITTLGGGWGLHDTGMRHTSDETWAYVLIPNLGFCWVPAVRL